MLSHQVSAGLITDARLLTETRNELADTRSRRSTIGTPHAGRIGALAQRDKCVAHVEERLSRSAASVAALTETQEKIALLASGAELRHVGERVLAGEHLAATGDNDLLLYDRGYSAFSLFALHDQEQIDVKNPGSKSRTSPTSAPGSCSSISTPEFSC